jgi:hypothetical protein
MGQESSRPQISAFAGCRRALGFSDMRVGAIPTVVIDQHVTVMTMIEPRMFQVLRSAFLLLLTTALTPSLAVAETRISLRIEFEPSVTERLLDMGEWVTVSTFYYGEPATKTVPVDEIGQVYLGGEDIRIFPVNQTIVVGTALTAAPLDWVLDPQVNVNVFTSRFVDEFNLIDCSVVGGDISVDASAAYLINCKWLGE